MRSHRETDGERSAHPSGHGGPDARRGVPSSEAIHVRNYDHQRSYDLDVELVADGGKTVLREHYYLLPGHTESESDVVPTGDYELRATLDNGHTETLQCRIDSTPDHTAVLELGNGALALSEGFHG